MMRTTRSDYGIYSKEDENDSIRLSTVSLDSSRAQQSNTYPNHRRTTNKRLNSSNNNSTDDTYNHGFMINSSFFDGHLFESSRSSYILDYNEAPKDVNRFLQGHQSANLDKHLFKLSFILTLSKNSSEKVAILDYFPREENESEIHSYEQFCFPEVNFNGESLYAFHNEQSSYVFTRILSNGQIEYGFCRRLYPETPDKCRCPIVICIVSAYNYFKLYDAILNEFCSAFLSNDLECNLLFQSFYSKPLPIPEAGSAGIVSILNDRRIFFYVCPRDERLNYDYFSTLISCLSPSNLVELFELMLHSKRILCFSNSLSKLTKCCLALPLLMNPFVWPYSFVSLMPSTWINDLLDSPCPYIYGCLSETASNLSLTSEKEIVRVDLDSNSIEKDFDDETLLPEDLRSTLQNSLEYIVRFRLIKVNSNLINVAVSEAFLRVFTELLYRLPEFFCRLTPKNKRQSINRQDSGIDLQSVLSNDDSNNRNEENRLGYDFRSDEFLIAQPKMSYVYFLNDFIRGMIFLKFLDDYQRKDENSREIFSIFAQRLKERRRIGLDELSIDPVLRFRQTFDQLEKQMKQTNRNSTPTFTKMVKNFFK